MKMPHIPKHSKRYRASEFKSIYKRLFQFMKPYRILIFLSVILIILSSLANSFAPYIMGKATDALIRLINFKTDSEAIPSFIRIIVLLGLTYVFYTGFKFLSSFLMVRVSQRTIFDLRQRIDVKLKHLPLSYFDGNSYGDILSRITNDVDVLSNSLQQSLELIISSFTSLILIFIMMFSISPLLTVIGLFTVPFSLLLSLTMAKSIQKYFSAQQQTLGEMNGFVEENYTGHKIISAFSAEEKSIRQFEAINQELYESGWKSQFYSGTLMPISQAMSNLGYIAIVVISALLVIQGKMSIGMIQSFIQYLRQFSMPISSIAQISTILQATAAATERVFEFLDEPEEIPDVTHPVLPNTEEIGIEFSHVRFGYSPDKILMQDISFSVEDGHKVAIVGPTGAGKTTLVNLLMRFYDVNNGKIMINQIDIRNMKRRNLREIFGMVLQDTWLFKGTIRENIRYGKPDATDKEIYAAAKAARADSFIKALPDGYDFELLEDASNLAQGERQLLTIARAILANRPIMILDEATSSVDTRTEVLIQEAMAALMKGRTSFVIAHRLSTIRDADTIIYMENGDIKEIGDHNTLLSKNGYYAKLYNSQFTTENG